MFFFKHNVFMFAILVCFMIVCNNYSVEADELLLDIYNDCIESIATLFEIIIVRSKEDSFCPNDLIELNPENCVKYAIKNLKDYTIVQDSNDEKNLKQKLMTVITNKKQDVEKVMKKLERTKSRLVRNIGSNKNIRYIIEDSGSQYNDNADMQQSLLEETESQESDQTKNTDLQESDKKEEIESQNSTKNIKPYGNDYYKSLGDDLELDSVLDPIKFCESREAKTTESQESGLKKRCFSSVNPFSKKDYHSDCTNQLKDFIESEKGALNYALYNVVLKDFERNSKNKNKNFQLQYMEEIIANVKVKPTHKDPIEFCDRKMNEACDMSKPYDD